MHTSTLSPIAHFIIETVDHERRDRQIARDAAMTRAGLQTAHPSLRSASHTGPRSASLGPASLRAIAPRSAALAIFDDYLGNFVNDPKNAIAQSEVKLTRRREAMASAEFYRGYIYFKRAEDKPASDPNWKLVVDNLSSYYLDYPEQEKLSPATMRMVAESHLALSETADARKVLDAMLERFADSQFTGRVSIEVYKKLKDDHDAAEQAGDDERAMALLREMAELLHSANATAATPSFDNLRNESRHWMDLREWKKAEAVLDTLRAKFSDSNTEDMVKYVLPDLGESYLRQKRVNDALEVLAPLNAEDAKPSKDVAVNYCKAVLGWVEEDEVGRITIVPGAAMQDPALVEDAVDKKLSPIEKSTESWSAEWCVAYFDYLYGYYVWSEINSVKLDTLKTFLSKMVTLMGGDRQFGDLCRAQIRLKDDIDLHDNVRPGIAGRVGCPPAGNNSTGADSCSVNRRMIRTDVWLYCGQHQ